jgi:1,4-alpha-glucan branching enzyme
MTSRWPSGPRTWRCTTGGFQPRPLKKGENGVWEATLGPIDPGTYRYLFNVDEVFRYGAWPDPARRRLSGRKARVGAV